MHLAQLNMKILYEELDSTLFSHVVPLFRLAQLLKGIARGSRPETWMAEVVLHLVLIAVSLPS